MGVESPLKFPVRRAAGATNGSAEGAAKLVELIGRSGGREEGVGFDGCVAEKFEGRTVELIRPGARDHVHDCAARAELGIVVSDLYFELADALEVRKDFDRSA